MASIKKELIIARKLILWGPPDGCFIISVTKYKHVTSLVMKKTEK